MVKVPGDPAGVVPDRACAIGTIEQPAKPAVVMTAAATRAYPERKRRMDVETNPSLPL